MSEDANKNTQNNSDNAIKATTDLKEVFGKLEQAISSQASNSKPIIRANCNFDDADGLVVFQNICSIEEDIYTKGYEVKVYENIEVTNIEDKDELKFFIKLEDRNGAYFVVELNEYKHKLTDDIFDEVDYWRDKLDRIAGISSTQHTSIARNIADYLALVIDRREFYYLKYKKIGWEQRFYDHYYGWIFKYDRIYSVESSIRGRVDSRCSYIYGTNPLSNYDDEEIKGIQEAWVMFTQHLLNHDHVEDCVLLGAGISGLIRQHLGRYKELGINMNICGKPASGKTTIGQFILGIFGPAEELEGSYIDTDNAREVIRSERPVLPYIFDDRLLKDYDKPRDKAEVSFIFDIFREYNGGTKERLGKQWEDISGEPTFSPLISSSVDSAMDMLLSQSRKGREDVGQYRRFIEIYAKDADDAILFENAEEANIAMEFAKKDYGYGIEIIANYMVKLIDDNKELDETQNTNNNIIVKRFNELRDRYIERIKNNNIQDFTNDLRASVNKFTLIILSYQILRESLHDYYSLLYNYSEDYEIIRGKDRSDEIFEFLENNLIDKFTRKRHAENKQNVGKTVYEYVLNNSSYFYNNANALSNKDMIDLLEDEKKKGKVYAGYYSIANQRIEVITQQKYGIHHIWGMSRLPKIEEVVKLISDIDKGAKLEDLLKDRFNLTKKDISNNNKEYKRSNTGGANPTEIRIFKGAITEYDTSDSDEE